MPNVPAGRSPTHTWQRLQEVITAADARSAFPYLQGALHGGEVSGAWPTCSSTCASGLPHSYKRTRNDLLGLRPTPANGRPGWPRGRFAARRPWAQLRQFEAEHGASESSYWLWFELLWRDYFRFLHLQHGPRCTGAAA